MQDDRAEDQPILGGLPAQRGGSPVPAPSGGAHSATPPDATVPFTAAGRQPGAPLAASGPEVPRQRLPRHDQQTPGFGLGAPRPVGQATPPGFSGQPTAQVPRDAQHRAPDQADPGDTTAIGSQPVAVSNPINADTMVLPAFVTGTKPPEPKPAEPARPAHDGGLPPSERGMLVFVAALLGAGTIAVVALMGLNPLKPQHHNTPPPPTPQATALGPAAGIPVDSPSPTPMATSAAPPSALPSSAPPAAATTTVKRSASPAPTLLGAAQPGAYCFATAHGAAVAPGHGTTSWTCVSGRRTSTTFTPGQVCDWEYGAASYAVVGDLADPSTWKCYKK